mmetsp:Transcript_54057/g.96170  ORF Transcript_54057/g.96170 Transcript_54057/m.96170 type:complete len:192 (+) Transcript_54057:380-955(+)
MQGLSPGALRPTARAQVPRLWTCAHLKMVPQMPSIAHVYPSAKFGGKFSSSNILGAPSAGRALWLHMCLYGPVRTSTSLYQHATGEFRTLKFTSRSLSSDHSPPSQDLQRMKPILGTIFYTRPYMHPCTHTTGHHTHKHTLHLQNAQTPIPQTPQCLNEERSVGLNESKPSLECSSTGKKACRAVFGAFGR